MLNPALEGQGGAATSPPTAPPNAPLGAPLDARISATRSAPLLGPLPGRLRAVWALVLAIALLGVLAGCAAPGRSIVSARFCEQNRVHNATTQDRLLRYAAAVRSELETSGESVALISRTGINLDRFDIRFSHAGIALRDNEDVPWSVRQLYYACDEGKPMLFDQGVAGFLFNSDEPELGHVSIILMPAPASTELARTALDRELALRLLAARYSANAYPFSDLYQNCNQWVIEMLATAWGGLPDGPDLRRRAQTWLTEAGYAPRPLILDSHPMRFAAQFMPLLQFDDHPENERLGMTMTVSLPDTIETFVRARLPEARRIEVCHDAERIVIRHGWTPIAAGCHPAEGDRVLSFDAVAGDVVGAAVDGVVRPLGG